MKKVLLLAVILVAAACSTAVPAGAPGVERLGATVLRYRGPEIEAAVGYRWAAANLGADWLIMDMSVTGTDEPVEIDRADIWVRTPQGATVPLADQKTFAGEYSRLQATLRAVSIAADPLDYFLGRQDCAMQLFAAPGTGVTFDSFTVDNRRVCYGRLYFPIDEGVQAGGWVLGIDLPESKIRMPFRLGEED